LKLKYEPKGGGVRYIEPDVAITRLRQWQIGERMTGKVMSQLGPERYVVRLGKNDIVCQTALELLPGDKLSLYVEAQDDKQPIGEPSPGGAGATRKPRLRVIGKSGQAVRGAAPTAELIDKLQLPSNQYSRGIIEQLWLDSAWDQVTDDKLKKIIDFASKWDLRTPIQQSRLVELWHRGLPLTREIWDRFNELRADKTSRGRLVEKTNWCAEPKQFSRRYWTHLGLDLESELRRGEVPEKENLRSKLWRQNHKENNVAAKELVKELEGYGVRAAAQQRVGAENIVLPLYFTTPGISGKSELKVSSNRTADGKKQRPRISMLLEMSDLGPIIVYGEPTGQKAYRFEISSPNPRVVTFMEQAAAPLRSALQKMLPCQLAYRVRPLGRQQEKPETQASRSPGRIDLQA